MISDYELLRQMIDQGNLIPKKVKEKYPYLHWCPEWDYLLIDKDDVEF